MTGYLQGINFDPTAQDNAAVINAALAEPGRTFLALPPGDIYLRGPLFVPSGRRVHGVLDANRVPQTRLIVAPDWQRLGGDAVIATVSRANGGSADVHFCGLEIDGCDALNTNANAPTVALRAQGRIHGLAFHATQGGSATDIVVRDVSGYADYCAGEADYLVRGIDITRVRTFNANAHHEIQYGADIRYRDCSAEHANDLLVGSEAMFYAYGRCENIEYLNCRAVGQGHGFLISDGCDNILIDGGHFESTNFYGLFIHSTENTGAAYNLDQYVKDLRVVNSTFIGRSSNGLHIADRRVRGMVLQRCRFESYRNDGGPISAAYVPHNPQIDAIDDCHFLAESIGGWAYGVTGVFPTRIMFGSITARGRLVATYGSTGNTDFETVKTLTPIQ